MGVYVGPPSPLLLTSSVRSGWGRSEEVAQGFDDDSPDVPSVTWSTTDMRRSESVLDVGLMWVA